MPHFFCSEFRVPSSGSKNNQASLKIVSFNDNENNHILVQIPTRNSELGTRNSLKSKTLGWMLFLDLFDFGDFDFVFVDGENGGDDI